MEFAPAGHFCECSAGRGYEQLRASLPHSCLRATRKRRSTLRGSIEGISLASESLLLEVGSTGIFKVGALPPVTFSRNRLPNGASTNVWLPATAVCQCVPLAVKHQKIVTHFSGIRSQVCVPLL